MDPTPTRCRHHDIQKFEGFRCCLACGHTIFEDNSNIDVAPNDTNSVPYSYKTLNYELGQEIRLLTLSPGLFSDDIDCEIIHVNLMDKPSYEAVSYTWATEEGDSSPTECIHPNGRSILVTKNCFAALRTVRKPTTRRTLWVDAICIDQNNIQERNHQVKMMDVIYSSANQVLIYLGQGSKEIDEVFDSLGQNILPSDERLLRTLQLLLRRRWFTRVWVLQEVALARVALLIVGNKVLHWTMGLTALLQRLYSDWHESPPSVLFWAPANVRHHPDLLQVLQWSRNCFATDPRDKVFAVLNLVERRYQEHIIVDYSMTIGQVFLSVAKHLALCEGRIGFLSHVSPKMRLPRRDDEDNLPTWVPRWDRDAPGHPFPRQFSDAQLEMVSTSWAGVKHILYMSETPMHTPDELHSTTAQRHGPSKWSNDKEWQEILCRSKASHVQSSAYLHDRDFHFTINRRELCSSYNINSERNVSLGRASYQTLIPDSILPCLSIKGHLLGSIMATWSIGALSSFPWTFLKMI